MICKFSYEGCCLITTNPNRFKGFCFGEEKDRENCPFWIKNHHGINPKMDICPNILCKEEYKWETKDL